MNIGDKYSLFKAALTFPQKPSSRPIIWVTYRISAVLSIKFGRTLAKLTQQFTVIKKEFAQYLGNGKNVLMVGNWIKNSLLEMVAKLYHFFLWHDGQVSDYRETPILYYSKTY